MRVNEVKVREERKEEREREEERSEGWCEEWMEERKEGRKERWEVERILKEWKWRNREKRNYQ